MSNAERTIIQVINETCSGKTWTPEILASKILKHLSDLEEYEKLEDKKLKEAKEKLISLNKTIDEPQLGSEDNTNGKTI